MFRRKVLGARIPCARGVVGSAWVEESAKGEGGAPLGEGHAVGREDGRIAVNKDCACGGRSARARREWMGKNERTRFDAERAGDGAGVLTSRSTESYGPEDQYGSWAI